MDDFWPEHERELPHKALLDSKDAKIVNDPFQGNLSLWSVSTKLFVVHKTYFVVCLHVVHGRLACIATHVDLSVLV